MSYPSALLPATAAADDVAVGCLALLARAIPERRHAPRRHRVTTGRRRALAATVRVVDRVHRGAARLRAHAEMALASRFADLDVLMVGVADRADRRAALRTHEPHLAGGQTQRDHAAVLREQLDAGSGGAAKLSTATRGQLHVVDDRTGRDVLERKRVADADLGFGTALHRRPDGESVRRQDVALLAVDVVQQRDVGGAVRVVLDMRDLRRDAVLAALEVDATVETLGAATAVAGGLAAARVAPAGLRQTLDERFLRLAAGDLGEVGIGDEAPARARRLRLADRHYSVPSRPWKIGIVSPGWSWTIAFFHVRVRPA